MINIVRISIIDRYTTENKIHPFVNNAMSKQLNGQSNVEDSCTHRE